MNNTIPGKIISSKIYSFLHVRTFRVFLFVLWQTCPSCLSEMIQLPNSDRSRRGVGWVVFSFQLLMCHRQFGSTRHRYTPIKQTQGTILQGSRVRLPLPVTWPSARDPGCPGGCWKEECCREGNRRRNILMPGILRVGEGEMQILSLNQFFS